MPLAGTEARRVFRQRVNLWNLEASTQSFNIVDIKPTNMEDLTEARAPAHLRPSSAAARAGAQAY